MSASEQPRWRGINHLALVTTDMDRTVRFYQGVLGARLVATIGTPAFRHYFFEFGSEQTVAFFEYRDAEIEPFAKPAGVPDRRAVRGAAGRLRGLRGRPGAGERERAPGHTLGP